MCDGASFPPSDNSLARRYRRYVELPMKTRVLFSTLILSSFVSSHSFAAQAQYEASIKNRAGYTVYQYEVTTDSASISGPYLSPNNASSGQYMSGTATATASGQVATAYVGTTLGSPTYAKVECAFQINGGNVNSNGTCTAPTISAYRKYGTGSAPTCYARDVIPYGSSDPCHFIVEFEYQP